ncbi:MAG: UDP-N-acetylmuramoyl-tripeptide--D-alanyl-D-alanine ligase [candidate division WOR-3 bacterium]|nr:MAG: UDP-N-acetylmuramoyl-tripeptide--D-alanyl-D-alanine ligase [candidate division WOR-3 bacterium]
MFREFTLAEITRMINGRGRTDMAELVRGVSINSRQTKPGDLFFALKGRQTDGHRYVRDALQEGALASVVEHPQSTGREIFVSDSLFALGELARRYRDDVKARTIGITGTNGKTTVKNMVAAILSMTGRVLPTKYNYNSLIGLPLTILRSQGDEDYLVLEMGTSAPGEIKRLCDIARPDIGLITNVGPGHLEGLQSIEGVMKEKISLVEALPENGLSLVGDGAGELGRSGVERFSSEMLEEITLTERGSYFSYDGNPYSTRLLGMGNAYNCLAAIRLTAMLGIPYHVQRRVLAQLAPEPGRMEPLHWGRLFIVNDTYNANPVSMRAAIDFTRHTKRRKIYVLGDMLELGDKAMELHEEIGKYARDSADLLITFGVHAEYYDGEHFTDGNRLLRYLKNNIAGDEVVLFKASRALHFETYVDALARLMR